MAASKRIEDALAEHESLAGRIGARLGGTCRASLKKGMLLIRAARRSRAKAAERAAGRRDGNSA
jgi:hypothetical protein